MSELKPCPFCGGKASVMGRYIVHIYCDKCHSQTGAYRDKDKAIEAWNRRAE